ncbi:hypothetical protein J1N35_026086 [Gossypium stocksii]|uniref:Reverse transcriptase domain-containing protein n=1 Tax=Gossypium stocksii TaxID=47602 RepID=A0A9D3ZYW7_9ROSI|nr:hypothetical protein J1N35_026086 [Gossypium stocksii]
MVVFRNQFHNHWIVGGDFNAIRNNKEMSNCVGLLKGSRDFRRFINKCKLVDVPLIGKKFTWYGPEKKKSRLDRFLVEEEWLVLFDDVQQQGIKRTILDHISILLSKGFVDWGPKPFKFFNAWLSNKVCPNLIKKEWEGLGGRKGSIFEKLRKLKGALRKWNGENGNVLEKRIMEIEERIQFLDVESENRVLIELEMEELRRLNLEFGETMRFKESIWKQKSRMSWLKEGDSNSVFFHSAVKFGNHWYSDPMALKEKLVNYFSDHFNCPLRNWKMDFALNFKRLNDSEASNLELLFSMEEIKEAMWSCDENKALGPDGFNICFFRKCWGVVKNDLYEMLKEFYLSGKLERSINSSFIALIPKNENPSEISEFRPICLVSSLYKIVVKVLSRRLCEVIGGVVSDYSMCLYPWKTKFFMVF